MINLLDPRKLTIILLGAAACDATVEYRQEEGAYLTNDKSMLFSQTCFSHSTGTTNHYQHEGSPEHSWPFNQKDYLGRGVGVGDGGGGGGEQEKKEKTDSNKNKNCKNTNKNEKNQKNICYYTLPYNAYFYTHTTEETDAVDSYYYTDTEGYYMYTTEQTDAVDAYYYTDTEDYYTYTEQTDAVDAYYYIETEDYYTYTEQTGAVDTSKDTGDEEADGDDGGGAAGADGPNLDDSGEEKEQEDVLNVEEGAGDPDPNDKEEKIDTKADKPDKENGEVDCKALDPLSNTNPKDFLTSVTRVATGGLANFKGWVHSVGTMVSSILSNAIPISPYYDTKMNVAVTLVNVAEFGINAKDTNYYMYKKEEEGNSKNDETKDSSNNISKTDEADDVGKHIQGSSEADANHESLHVDTTAIPSVSSLADESPDTLTAGDGITMTTSACLHKDELLQDNDESPFVSAAADGGPWAATSSHVPAGDGPCCLVRPVEAIFAGIILAILILLSCVTAGRGSCSSTLPDMQSRLVESKAKLKKGEKYTACSTKMKTKQKSLRSGLPGMSILLRIFSCVSIMYYASASSFATQENLVRKFLGPSHQDDHEIHITLGIDDEPAPPAGPPDTNVHSLRGFTPIDGNDCAKHDFVHLACTIQGHSATAATISIAGRDEVATALDILSDDEISQGDKTAKEDRATAKESAGSQDDFVQKHHFSRSSEDDGEDGDDVLAYIFDQLDADTDIQSRRLVNSEKDKLHKHDLTKDNIFDMLFPKKYSCDELFAHVEQKYQSCKEQYNYRISALLKEGRCEGTGGHRRLPKKKKLASPDPESSKVKSGSKSGSKSKLHSYDFDLDFYKLREKFSCAEFFNYTGETFETCQNRYEDEMAALVKGEDRCELPCPEEGCIFIEIKPNVDQCGVDHCNVDLCDMTNDVLATASDIIADITSIKLAAEDVISDSSPENQTALYAALIQTIAKSTAFLPTTSVAFTKSNERRPWPSKFVVAAQNLTLPFLQSTADTIKKLLTGGYKSFSKAVRSYLSRDSSLDLILERAGTISDAYAAFLGSRGFDEGSSVKDKYVIDFRNLCSHSESSDLTPKEMFFHIYGYACGIAGHTRECKISDFGECPFGLKKDIALDRLALEDLNSYRTWILSTMAHLMYAHAACLPSNEETCISHNDQYIIQDMENMKQAYDEVVVNLARAEACAHEAQADYDTLFNDTIGGSRRRLQVKERNVTACVTNDLGERLSRTDVNYIAGTQRQELDLTGAKATDHIQVAYEIAGEVALTVGAAVETLSKFSKVAAAFGGAGVALSIASVFIGRSADDITQALIKQEFEKTNAKIDLLGKNMNAQFAQIRKDIGDFTIDEVISALDRITNTFQDYVEASSIEALPGTTSDYLKAEKDLGPLRERYTNQFRYSCNQLRYRPQEIVKFLYGHVCGDAPWDLNRCENSVKGSGAGDCKYGRKQSSYLFDTYRKANDGQNTDALFLRRFKNWILGAMAQAIFLQAVCIPLNEKACPTTSDPVFEQRYNESLAAYEEALKNIEEAENCNCPCKDVTITEIFFDGDDSGSYGEVRIWIDDVLKYPCITQGPRPIGGWGDILCDNEPGEMVDGGYTPFGDVPLKEWKTFLKPIKLGVLTEKSPKHSIRLKEWDDWDDEDASKDVVVTDWYDNTCADYTKEITFKDDSQDTWKLKYSIKSVKNDKCPNDFCSDELPDACREDKYCNFTTKTCVGRLGFNGICKSDSECLSWNCTEHGTGDYRCGPLLAVGEDCDYNIQCLHYNANSPTRQFKCEETCVGLPFNRTCTVDTECKSGNCNSSTTRCA